MLFLIGLLIGIIFGMFWQKIKGLLTIYVYFVCKKYLNLHTNEYDQKVFYKLSAIKKYRELTGKGLRESKEQIEKWFNC